MKTLELEIKKMILIVEGDFITYHNGKPLKFICKASEITEDIAKEFVEDKTDTYSMYFNGGECFKGTDGIVRRAEHAFITFIEAKGYYWGENPLQSNKPTDDLSFYDNEIERSICIEKWNEAELKTFDLSKTLIFEIL